MQAAFERARKALDFLEHHLLEPTPSNFEFALFYLSHPASALRDEVDAHTDGGLRLTAEAVAIIGDRLLRPDPALAVGQRERTVARQADTLDTLASDAHDLTRALERDMSNVAAEATNAPDTAGAFISRLSQAERELAELRGEISRLRDDVGKRTSIGASATGGGALSHDDGGLRRLIDQFVADGRPYTLVLFSLDNLDDVNQRFGHLVGENVRNAFAATLASVFRDRTVLHWSDNEFVLVAPGVTVARVAMLADEALAAIRSRRLLRRGSGEWIGRITASAGIVSGETQLVDDVIEHARACVRVSVDSGGDRAVCQPCRDGLLTPL